MKKHIIQLGGLVTLAAALSACGGGTTASGSGGNNAEGSVKVTAPSSGSVNVGSSLRIDLTVENTSTSLAVSASKVAGTSTIVGGLPTDGTLNVLGTTSPNTCDGMGAPLAAGKTCTEVLVYTPKAAHASKAYPITLSFADSNGNIFSKKVTLNLIATTAKQGVFVGTDNGIAVASTAAATKWAVSGKGTVNSADATAGYPGNNVTSVAATTMQSTDTNAPSFVGVIADGRATTVQLKATPAYAKTTKLPAGYSAAYILPYNYLFVVDHTGQLEQEISTDGTNKTSSFSPVTTVSGMPLSVASVYTQAPATFGREFKAFVVTSTGIYYRAPVASSSIGVATGLLSWTSTPAPSGTVASAVAAGGAYSSSIVLLATDKGVYEWGGSSFGSSPVGGSNIGGVDTAYSHVYVYPGAATPLELAAPTNGGLLATSGISNFKATGVAGVVSHVAFSSNASAYVATSNGLYSVTGLPANPVVKTITTAPYFGTGAVSSMVYSNGSLFVGTKHGVYQYNGSAWTQASLGTHKSGNLNVKLLSTVVPPTGTVKVAYYVVAATSDGVYTAPVTAGTAATFSKLTTAGYSKVGSINPSSVHEVAVQQGTDTAYMLTNNGLYVSSNGNWSTWTKKSLSSKITTAINQVLPSSHSTLVYLATNDGVWTGVPGEATWTQALKGDKVYAIAHDGLLLHGNNFYALTNKGLYSLNMVGSTATPASATPSYASVAGQFGDLLSFTEFGSAQDQVYFNGSDNNVYRSGQSGQAGSWGAVSNYPAGFSGSTLLVHGSNLFVGGHGTAASVQVYNGATWKAATGLPAGAKVQVLAMSADGATLYAGTKHHGLYSCAVTSGPAVACTVMTMTGAELTDVTSLDVFGSNVYAGGPTGLSVYNGTAWTRYTSASAFAGTAVTSIKTIQ